MGDSTTLQGAGPLLASLQALPVGVHMMLGVGLAAGLVLWVAGQKVARPIFAVMGLVFGASIGFFVGAMVTTEPVNGIPAPYLGMGAGGLLGLGGAVALFRFSMALGAAIVVSIASMMGMAIHLERGTASSERQAWVSAAKESGHSRRGTLASIDLDSHDSAALVAREAAGRTREFLSQAGGAATARWAQVPSEHQLLVAGSGMGGAMLGFLCGVFVPRRSAAVVTALLGSGLWMACGVWAAHATGAPGVTALEQPAMVWMIAWGVTAAAGVMIQWISMSRRSRTAD